MKTLIMVRHAQSGNHSATNKDIDRTLDNRGRMDAADMAKILKKNKITPDVFLSSPAQRAIETASCFLNTFEADRNKLLVDSKLYEPTVSGIYTVTEQILNNYNVAIIFTHNPGITAFINDLLGSFPYSMPTCGMLAVKIVTDDWNEIRFAERQLLFFEYPGRVSK